MDTKAFYNLSYGVFVLGAKNEGKINACITNTCIQIASDPTRVAIAVLNKNYTCDLIKASGKFSISVLDKTCTFDLIENFGMHSGRDFDKFKSFPCKTTGEGIPYITKSVCSLFECKVLSKQDLGSHTLFIAEVENAEVVSSNAPLTYADYQSSVKPKQKIDNSKKIIGWRCKICGYEEMISELPKGYTCPLCSHPADDFEPIYES